MRTKFEILQSYSIENKRDTWANLGSLTHIATTRYYTKGSIYRIMTGTINLGQFILCIEDFSTPTVIDWDTYTFNTNGDIISETAITNPYFKFVLSATDYGTILAPIDTNFIPYNETISNSILIPDEQLELIMLEVGVPFITFEELEYPKDKIINLMVKPAIQEYFKWYPKIRTEDYSAPTNHLTEIEFPSDCYGVVRTLLSQGTSANGVQSPILRYFDEMVWANGQSSTPNRLNGSRRPGYANLQGWNTMALDRAARQGIMNASTRIHFDVYINDLGKRILRAHNNKIGMIEVQWALFSNSWNDIEFTRWAEVRDLATAKVLRAFGSLRSQVKSDLPGTIDYSGFISRAQELEEKVMAKWQSTTKVVIIRGGLS